MKINIEFNDYEIKNIIQALNVKIQKEGHEHSIWEKQENGIYGYTSNKLMEQLEWTIRSIQRQIEQQKIDANLSIDSFDEIVAWILSSAKGDNFKFKCHEDCPILEEIEKLKYIEDNSSLISALLSSHIGENTIIVDFRDRIVNVNRKL